MGKWIGWRFRVLAIVLGGWWGSAQAGVVHDPAFEWKTLHTPHFAIHFHDGAEDTARRTAAIAERVHERLTRTFKWKPEDRTDIVLTDEYDVSNGYATSFTANRVNLFTAPPDAINSLEDNDGWLETLIAHEYTHIVHLDKASGYPKALRKIFGRVASFFPGLNAFPGWMQPTWMIEGMAVYHETDRARGTGRGQSTYYDMLMRMEVMGEFKPIRQVNWHIGTWPGGTTPYLYGSAYYRFVADTRGPDKIQALVEDFSNDVVPFMINTNSKHIFRKNLNRMWDEFEAHLRSKHEPRLAAIRDAGVRAGQRLSQNGYQAGSLDALPDGSVFYVAFDGRNDPALMVYRPGFTKPKQLAEVHYGAYIDAHPKAGVLVAQPEVCRNTRYYYDLYRYDAKSGRRTRLTSCARYRHAAWSPAGDRIVAVHHQMGQSRLEVLDAKGRQQEVLWSGANGDVIAEVDWSPDGDSIVAAVWRRESGWNIEQFFIKERLWRTLTADSAIDAQPRFSADGRSVLFSSDHGGVYNLRRYDLASGRIDTLSNVLGGAFYPAESGSVLYYIGYGPEGFDLHRLSETATSPTPRAVPGPSVIVEKEAPPVENARVTGYDPDTGVRPRAWFPWIAFDSKGDRYEFGASTWGWDPLVRHIYAVAAAYDFKNDSPVGSIDYIYDRWYPTLKLHVARFNDFTLDAETDDVRRVRHEDTYQAELVFPWIKYRRDLTFRMAALAEKESDGKLALGEPQERDTEDKLAGIGITYDSTRRYPLSVSRSHGREVRLIGESSDAFVSDYTGEVYTADWREFLSLGREHVLSLRLVEGYGVGSPRPFELGGVDTDQMLPSPLESTVYASPFNRREYALRGYPEGRDDLTGQRMRLASLEYRFPILRVERGSMVPLPAALHHLSGTVFVDSGSVWSRGSAANSYRTGAGVELMTSVGLLYMSRADLRLGYAHGYDNGGEDQVYLRVGASF